jgi:hypothetical protein
MSPQDRLKDLDGFRSNLRCLRASARAKTCRILPSSEQQLLGAVSRQ